MGLSIKLKELHMKHISGSSISGEIKAWEIIGITGPNGSGKSELLRYLSGLMRTESMGEIVMEGLDPFHAHDLEQLRRKVGVAFQAPEDTMVFSGIPQDAAFGPENHAVAPEIIRKRWEGLKGRLLSDIPEGRPFTELSGGQKQRAALVSVLMLRAELMLLDEPLSMQGEEEGREVLSLLLSLARRSKQTVLIVSHDPEVLKKVDRVLVLEGGHVEEVLPGDTASPESVIFEEASDMTVEEASSYLDPEGKLRWAIRRRSESEEILIKMEQVVFRFGKQMVLDGFSAEVRAGGIYCILGGTGEGKSTLCKLMNGTLAPQSGQIVVGGTHLPLAGSRRKWSLFHAKEVVPMAPVRHFAGYVMQAPEDQLFEKTVLRDVMYGPLSAGRADEIAKRDAEEALRLLAVSERLWNRRPEKLSGGEKRRVAIAGILAMKPRVLILDEPYAGLDPEGQRIVRRMIESYAKQGNAVVLTAH